MANYPKVKIRAEDDVTDGAGDIKRESMPLNGYPNKSSWRSSADGMLKMGNVLKLKQGVEQRLKDFGATKVRPVLKAIASYKKPQGSLKARQMAWDEGGSGSRPIK